MINDNLKKVLCDKFGNRVQNGECCFCGKELNINEYCTCNGAKKVNRYFSKVHKKWDEIDNLKALYGNDLKDFCFTVNTPKIFEGLTFDDYKVVEPDSAKKKNVLNAVSDYYKKACLNYLLGNNLILIGNPGTGKTMLLSILANELASDYFNVKFINIVDLFENIKATFNNTGKICTKEYIDNYKSVEYLFIDDLDKKKTPTDYIKEVLYSIFNYRTEHQLPTIISANSDLNVLDDIFGEVIISRLVQKSTVVVFSHGNERLKG